MSFGHMVQVLLHKIEHRCLLQIHLPADTTLLSTFSSKAPSLPVAGPLSFLAFLLHAMHMHLLVIH